MIGEVASSSLRGSSVHHGNRGRVTSSGAGSTHREYSRGRISSHPRVGTPVPAHLDGSCQQTVAPRPADKPNSSGGYLWLVLVPCHVLCFALFTPCLVWTAQKRTKVGSHWESASARTPKLLDIKACDIAAPPRCVFLQLVRAVFSRCVI